MRNAMTRHGRERGRVLRWSLVAAAVLTPLPECSIANAATPLDTLFYSPDVTVILSGSTFNDESIVVERIGGALTAANVNMAPSEADVDAYHRQQDGSVLISFDRTVNLPGGLTVEDRDVVAVDMAGFSQFFDGSSAGVPDGAGIDAVTVLSQGNLLLSFDTTVAVDGITAEDEDLVEFDPSTGFTLFWDASAAGVAAELDLDAAHHLNETGTLLLSFDTSGTVGGVSFDDEDVLEHDPVGGGWELAHDGSARHPEWAAADLDALYATVSRDVTRLFLFGGGAGRLTTLGESGVAQAGYAAVTVNSGQTPYGIAVFSTTVNGIVVSEAGVPASPPLLRTRIFIDSRNNVTLPTPQSTGTITVTTGIGVANPGTSNASITYTLRNAAGESLAVGHGTLEVGRHFAAVISNLQSVAPDFNLPPDFAASFRFGSLDVEADQPLSVMALRGALNQRGELLLTSTPVADLGAAASSQPVFFPHLADSGGFTTLLFLLNTTGTRQSGIMEFFDDDGDPLVITPADGSPGASFSYAMPGNGVFVFESSGSDSSVNSGWIRVSPAVGNSAPAGAGAFQVFSNGILLSESGIPSARPTTRARVYIDKTGGHDNGVALANPDGSPANLVLRSFQLDGSTPAGSGSTSFQINALGHRADLAGGFISGLSSGFRGVFEIASSTPFVALNLRALINGRSEILLTTFPIADTTRPAPSPVIFPHFADGGGFRTEIILQSPSSEIDAAVRFIGDDNLPVPVSGLHELELFSGR